MSLNFDLTELEMKPWASAVAMNFTDGLELGFGPHGCMRLRVNVYMRLRVNVSQEKRSTEVDGIGPVRASRIVAVPSKRWSVRSWCFCIATALARPG
jgi:hypothetical protein